MEQRSLMLTAEQWRQLEDAARRAGATAQRGPKTGAASWRVLLARLADDERLLREVADRLAGKEAPSRHELPTATVLRPPSPVAATLAWVSVEGERVRLHYPEKDERLRAVVKRMGYAWDESCWVKKAGQKTARARAAELCRRLLEAGFCVVPPSPAVAELVISGDYADEPRRQVRVMTSGDYRGWFALWWAKDEDLYNAAIQLTAARYSPPYVVVPPEHYAEVLDFAEVHGCQVTAAAVRRAEEAAAMLAGAWVVTPEARDEPARVDERPTLEPEPGEIDDALADEPL